LEPLFVSNNRDAAFGLLLSSVPAVRVRTGSYYIVSDRRVKRVSGRKSNHCALWGKCVRFVIRGKDTYDVIFSYALGIMILTQPTPHHAKKITNESSQ